MTDILPPQAYQVSFSQSLTEIPAVQWNRLNRGNNPFCRHEFLLALEASDSVCAHTGWAPRHISVRDDQDQLVAAIPTYLKSHSYGEYVFDWAWADAYQRHGLNYYPKLVSAIPFTPSVGPRILLADEVDASAVFGAIEHAVTAYLDRRQLSGWHLLFPDTTSRLLAHPDRPLVNPGRTLVHQSQNSLQRQGTQFHWHNHQYQSFDHFLDHLTSRKRKNIRKERRKVIDAGAQFRWFEGDNISDEVLKNFYQFYQMTYFKRGQQPYLQPAFFHQVRDTMPENMLLLQADYQQRPVAGALFFKGSDTLYGRYWGCVEEFDQLHFECCYYQGIEYAIAHQMTLFDAGAQGEHKIMRGFEPIPTYSLHWIQQPQFRQAIADFLEQEKQGVDAYMADAATILPYKTPQGA